MMHRSQAADKVKSMQVARQIAAQSIAVFRKFPMHDLKWKLIEIGGFGLQRLKP